MIVVRISITKKSVLIFDWSSKAVHGAYWSCAVDPRYILAWHTPKTYAHFTYRGIDFHFFQD